MPISPEKRMEKKKVKKLCDVINSIQKFKFGKLFVDIQFDMGYYNLRSKKLTPQVKNISLPSQLMAEKKSFKRKMKKKKVMKL